MRTLLYNGKIYVERGHFAEALCIENGIIAAVGTNQEIRALAVPGASEMDCGGRTVIPGLNDSHMHLLMIGIGLAQVDIAGVKSIGEMIGRVRRFIAERPQACGRGVHSIGWNQDLFTDGEKRMPNRHDLDKISTEIPIVLERICGHATSANTKAIEMLGLGCDSPQFDGGTFEREADGYPNGIFTENACRQIASVIPNYTPEEYESMFLDAMDYAVAHGITSVQSNDIGSNAADRHVIYDMINRIFSEDRSKLRYHPQVCFLSVSDFKDYLNGSLGTLCSHPWLAPASLKLFKDGSLGARTATMRHEYLDNPGNYGVEVMTAEQADEFCALADAANMQVVTHVIGDKAVEDTVSSYEKVSHGGKNPLRHGLIHCQITDRPLLERIVKDNIPVFYQPIFLDYDMHVVISRCGKELSSTSYAFRTVEKLGGHVSYGTDSPVEDCNPFPNIYAAVTRRDKNGWPEGGFFPDECVDVYSAIDAYTAGSAWAEFRENDKGRLKPGYVADLTVLDTDIFTCDPMKIRDILPVMTMTGGKIVYKK